MGWMDLKYLGLSSEDAQKLLELVRSRHPRGGMQTASGCVCGASSGGPASGEVCRVLEKLIEAGRTIRLGFPSPRDRSICSHEHNGKLQVFEFEEVCYCQLCGSAV